MISKTRIKLIRQDAEIALSALTGLLLGAGEIAHEDYVLEKINIVKRCVEFIESEANNART